MLEMWFDHWLERSMYRWMEWTRTLNRAQVRATKKPAEKV
jgi:hypothetical protein